MPSRRAELRKPSLPPLHRVSLNVKRHRSIQNVIVIDLGDPRQISTFRCPNPRLAHGRPRIRIPQSPHDPPYDRRCRNQPRRVHAKPEQRNQAHAEHDQRSPTHHPSPTGHVPTAITASEPATTPSSAAAATADLRSRGISGPLIATSTNPGRKIPTVATAAPAQPATTYPINVAVVNTGPGVNCPTATASSNCFSVSQCRRSTNSV